MPYPLNANIGSTAAALLAGNQLNNNAMTKDINIAASVDHQGIARGMFGKL